MSFNIGQQNANTIINGNNEWISVNDKLPEQYQRVVIYKEDVVLMCYGVAIYNGKKFLYDASLINNEKVFELLSDKPLTGVTHWIPLTPPSPKP